MPKDKVVAGRPHPHPAAPGAPSPTGEGAAAGRRPEASMRLGETWRTAEPRQWRLLQPEAQRMRRAPTAAESALWNALRNGALGARFRRQQVVDRFVVDFCCLRAKLAVEVDGPIHRHRTAEDAARDAALVERGFRVLRFPNQRIVNDLDGVLEEIRQHLVADPVNRSPASSRNSPSPVGEGAGG